MFSQEMPTHEPTKIKRIKRRKTSEEKARDIVDKARRAEEKAAAKAERDAMIRSYREEKKKVAQEIKEAKQKEALRLAEELREAKKKYEQDMKKAKMEEAQRLKAEREQVKEKEKQKKRKPRKQARNKLVPAPTAQYQIEYMDLPNHTAIPPACSPVPLPHSSLLSDTSCPVLKNLVSDISSLSPSDTSSDFSTLQHATQITFGSNGYTLKPYLVDNHFPTHSTSFPPPLNTSLLIPNEYNAASDQFMCNGEPNYSPIHLTRRSQRLNTSIPISNEYNSVSEAGAVFSLDALSSSPTNESSEPNDEHNYSPIHSTNYLLQLDTSYPISNGRNSASQASAFFSSDAFSSSPINESSDQFMCEPNGDLNYSPIHSSNFTSPLKSSYPISNKRNSASGALFSLDAFSSSPINQSSDEFNGHVDCSPVHLSPLDTSYPISNERNSVSEESALFSSSPINKSSDQFMSEPNNHANYSPEYISVSETSAFLSLDTFSSSPTNQSDQFIYEPSNSPVPCSVASSPIQSPIFCSLSPNRSSPINIPITNQIFPTNVRIREKPFGPEDYQSTVFIWDIDDLTKLSRKQLKMAPIQEKEGTFFTFLDKEIESEVFWLDYLLNNVLTTSGFSEINDEVKYLKSFDNIMEVEHAQRSDSTSRNVIREFVAPKVEKLRKLYNLVSKDFEQLIARSGKNEEQKVLLHQVVQKYRDSHRSTWESIDQCMRMQDFAKWNQSFANVVICSDDFGYGAAQILLAGYAQSVPIDNIYSFEKDFLDVTFGKIQARFGNNCRLRLVTSNDNYSRLAKSLNISDWFIRDIKSFNDLYATEV